MGLLKLIADWWHARQRAIDMQILWPICLRGAPDLDHALAAFAVHCFNDPAWLALGEDELRWRINRLGVQAQRQLAGD
jgi:hypothetical protein